MQMKVLAEIPFNLDIADLQQRLRIKPDSEDAAELRDLAEEACRIAKPKALYKESYVEARGSNTVTLDGVTFTSSALRANLDSVERVFPYVATCGREVDEIILPAQDVLRRYWLDTIKAELLAFSRRHLSTHLDKKYALSKTATMSPGSGDATVWPIEQQRLLFSLLGDVQELIGVTLTDNCLMHPVKSVSGIRFPTEISFQSCQLCHREDCPSRCAPFDQALWESTQGSTTSEA